MAGAEEQGREVRAGEQRGPSRVEREVGVVVSWLLSDDWRQSLAAQRLLAESYLPWLERRAVHRARGVGASWAAIARVMRRTRQAVRQRFAESAVFTVADLLPPALPESRADADGAELWVMLADIRRRREADDASAVGSLVPW